MIPCYQFFIGRLLFRLHYRFYSSVPNNISYEISVPIQSLSRQHPALYLFAVTIGPLLPGFSCLFTFAATVSNHRRQLAQRLMVLLSLILFRAL